MHKDLTALNFFDKESLHYSSPEVVCGHNSSVLFPVAIEMKKKVRVFTEEIEQWKEVITSANYEILDVAIHPEDSNYTIIEYKIAG